MQNKIARAMKNKIIIILFLCVSVNLYSQRASQFRAKAEKGDPTAQMYLGLCYNEGKGTIKDSEKAFYWYHRSAQRGLAEAQVLVGNCYKEGKGTEKNDSLAYYWYERASECDFAPALDAIGDCFKDGIFVKKDANQAKSWYNKALKKKYYKSKAKLDEVNQIIESSKK